MSNGPTRNFIAMANTAFLVPQAITLGCEAMNRPDQKKIKEVEGIPLCV